MKRIRTSVPSAVGAEGGPPTADTSWFPLGSR